MVTIYLGKVYIKGCECFLLYKSLKESFLHVKDAKVLPHRLQPEVCISEESLRRTNRMRTINDFSARPHRIFYGLSSVGMSPHSSPPAAASAWHCNKCVFNCSEANLSHKLMIMITLHEKSLWRGEPEERKRDEGLCECVH